MRVISKVFVLILVLVLGLASVLVASAPAEAALDLSSILQYFDINYSASFSSHSISGSQTFTMSISATATCKQDLPTILQTISAVKLSGHVIGRNTSNQAVVELNPLYTLNIANFPKKAGQSYSDSESLTMQFPSGTPSGTYAVIGEPGAQGGAWVTVLGTDFPVTSYLPSSQQFTTVTYTAAPVSNGGGGGGGGGGVVVTQPTTSTPTVSPTPTSTQPVIIDLTGKSLTALLNADNKLTSAIQVKSTDGNCLESVAKDTKVQFPANSTSILGMAPTSNPPQSNSVRIAGAVYDLTPSGTTFDPPLSLTLSYDPQAFTGGISAKDLTIATWNPATSTWDTIKGAVDESKHTLTAAISHFSYYAIVAQVPVTPSVSPSAAASPTPSVTPTPPTTTPPAASPTAVATTTAPAAPSPSTSPVQKTGSFPWAVVIIIGVVVIAGVIIGALIARRRSQG